MPTHQSSAKVRKISGVIVVSLVIHNTNGKTHTSPRLLFFTDHAVSVVEQPASGSRYSEYYLEARNGMAT